MRTGHASLRVKVVASPKPDEWLSTPYDDGEAMERLSSMSSPISPSFRYSPTGVERSASASPAAASAEAAAMVFKTFTNPLAESTDGVQPEVRPAAAPQAAVGKPAGTSFA